MQPLPVNTVGAAVKHDDTLEFHRVQRITDRDEPSIKVSLHGRQLGHRRRADLVREDRVIKTCPFQHIIAADKQDMIERQLN